MSSVLERPVSQQRQASPGSPVQLAARGALAGISVIAVSAAILLVVVLVTWAAADHSVASAAGASRTALAIVLLAIRVPIHVSTGTVAMPPLGMTLLMCWVISRSAATLLAWWSGNDVVDVRAGAAPVPAPSARQIAEVLAAICVPFSILLLSLGLGISHGSLRPSIAGSIIAGLVVPAIASVVGMWRRGLTDGIAVWIPQAVREGAIGALAASGIIVVGATACLAGSLLWHAHAVGHLASASNGGTIGDIALFVGCILLLPNAVLATVGYLCGAGVAIGKGTSVTMGVAHLGKLPPVPLLASLPHGPAPAGVRVAAWVIIGAAAISAPLLPRRSEPTMRDLLIRAGVASLGCAVLLGIFIAVAGGPAGPGGLAQIGSSGWVSSLLLLVELCAGAVISAVARSCWAAIAEAREAMRPH